MGPRKRAADNNITLTLVGPPVGASVGPIAISPPTGARDTVGLAVGLAVWVMPLGPSMGPPPKKQSSSSHWRRRSPSLS